MIYSQQNNKLYLTIFVVLKVLRMVPGSRGLKKFNC